MTKKGAKGGKKRTKSQASPSAVDSQPDKRANMSGPQTPQNTAGSGYIQQTPPYAGQYYPPHLQFVTPQQSPPVQPAMATLATGDTLTQTILSRLDSIDTRLRKLDTIDSKVTQLSQKIVAMETKVDQLETSVQGQNKKISDLEKSRNFDAKACDDIKSKQTDLESSLKDAKEKNSKILNDMKKIQDENIRLNEEMLDLQSRSMRDNLLFFNFDEIVNPEERANENCTKKITDFLANELQISDAPDIKIDRAHRIGKFYRDKKRPIVVKFNFHQDKVRVKQSAFEKLRESNFRVSDQYPKEIQERRKRLIPVLIEAKRSGKRAALSYDKLYIDGRLYNPEPQA